MTEIVTIGGSPSINSRSSAVLDYVRAVLQRHRLDSASINIRDFNAEDLLYARFDSASVLCSRSKIENARAVIIATPVYKAAYSGALKTFLDLLPQNALAGKIVLPIATGGSPGHLLSIDYALRPVLTALGAEHILRGVYILDTQIQYREDKEFKLDADVEQRLLGSLETLTNSLVKTEIASLTA